MRLRERLKPQSPRSEFAINSWKVCSILKSSTPAYIAENEDGVPSVALEHSTEALYDEFLGSVTIERIKDGNPLAPLQYQSFEYASTF